MADGWSIGKPDAVFEMKEPYQIPARGTIEYQYIRIPTGITEDKWLQAIEIKPQARVLATDRGISCAVVDYDALRGMDDATERLF